MGQADRGSTPSASTVTTWHCFFSTGELIDRDAWLSSKLNRYDQAPIGTLDASAYSRCPSLPETAWVAGRLNYAPGTQAGVSSGGVTIQFAFENPARAEILRDGDIVAVLLRAEVAIDAILLAPCLESPEWQAGLAPQSGRRWTAFLQAVRSFLVAHDFIEARTPALVAAPGTEPYLEVFETSFQPEGSTGAAQLFLPTSPEFHLKRLLVAGWPRIFEIKDCFRNGEVGPSHQPEFAMLEWYRSYETLDAIADDAEALISSVCLALQAPAPAPARRTTMRALFREFHDFELRPDSSESDLRALCQTLGIDARSDDSWDDLFFRVFLHRIEPSLGSKDPIFVRDYPPRLAALSRIKNDGWADRMEIYWKGLELANGFNELNDPELNKIRFKEDRLVRVHRGRKPFPEDAALMRALRAGMPPAAGIAVGLDRLFMAVTGLIEIGKARPFPFTQHPY